MTAAHPGLQGRPAYLDYNATTPIDPRVLDAMLPYLTVEFGNPSSTHIYGRSSASALHEARKQVAALVAARPDEIVFTGSGTEADNLAIRGAVLASGTPRPHIVTQATEHPAVIAACEHLARFHDADVTVLPVDGYGVLDPAAVAAAITSNTVLVTIMHANNETGTIQPIPEIANVTRAAGVLLHCDAAQSVGKIDVDVAVLGVDLLTIVGHKMYAPKGVAALYVRNGVDPVPLIGGGVQENGRRAGTENVAYAVGLGVAAELARTALKQGETARLSMLRDHLLATLQDRLPGRVHLNGAADHRLPNTVNVSIDRAPALGMLAAIPEVAASAGSACHAGRDEPSPVLTAMGIPAARALTALRLSMGRWTTYEEVDRSADALAAAAR